MEPLSAWFKNLFFNSGGDKRTVITVIGSGGKTSLIWHLASSLAEPDRRILVTTTTKMLVPLPGAKLYDFYCGGGNYNEACNSGALQNPAPGITLAGNYNKASGKLEPLLPDDLEKIYSAYDLVLIEGDGAKGLPLKAWSNYEPVVPAFSDFTIGILPLINMGEPVSEKIIHRLPLFLDLSGAAEGEPIKKEHLVKIITGGTQGGRTLPGLFSRAKGKKILFFNQAEDDAAIKNAIKIAESLPPDFRKDLYAISAGSIKLNNLINLFSEETR